jgi:hypothetical protein
MCIPLVAVAAISLIATAASAAMSIVGQQQQKKSTEQYQQKLTDANVQQMQENRDMATKAYLDQATAAHTQLAETREATAAANFDESRKANEARGSALASAAEAGVYGVSLDALLGDFHRHEAMFSARNETNLLFKQQQTAKQVSGYYTEAKARTAGVRPIQLGPVKPVDYVGPMLSVVQAGANMGMNIQSGANRGANIRDSSGIF